MTAVRYNINTYLKRVVIPIFIVCCFLQKVSGHDVRDTTFLLREFLDTITYHVVYIEQNRQSFFYKEIKDHISIDTSFYNQTIRELKDSIKHPLKHIPAGLPDENWYSLWRCKNQYYMYAASESFVNIWFRITDSTVSINSFNDGVLPALIKSATWENSRTLHIKTIDKYDVYNDIIIHILNRQKGWMILEYPKQSPDSRYVLMVSASHMKDYPLIVNYCKEQRVMEWNFDKIDFKKLLKN